MVNYLNPPRSTKEHSILRVWMRVTLISDWRARMMTMTAVEVMWISIVYKSCIIKVGHMVGVRITGLGRIWDKREKLVF